MKNLLEDKYFLFGFIWVLFTILLLYADPPTIAQEYVASKSSVLKENSVGHSYPKGSISITDMAGRNISLPATPSRIACIGPGALRLIVYLEAHEKVAGVEDMEKLNPGGRPYWLATHQKFEKLPRIGPVGPAGINKKPDMEALLAVNPDLIFITYMDAGLADEVEKTLSIPVVVLSYGALGTFDKAVFKAMEIAGKVLDRKKRANEIIEYIEALRKDLQHRTGDIPDNQKPGVYVGGIGYRGAHGIESTESNYIPLDWCNAINLAERIEARIGSHIFADKEILLGLDPDVIFIDGGGLELVIQDFHKKKKFYRALKAFRNQRIYTLLPFNFYSTNIATALSDAYAIGKILYPDQFKDLDVEKKGRRDIHFSCWKTGL
ncbi:conserved exported hypothetical protein [Desulfamplus magnetovallimortis]|uniref:Fe/B12 periplasmic-binding domain-containing protein n=1 Tax=Desulfamplus magnetovallimortis TaxID=1246637 RepID=A0A1W1HBK8_9BACT|nr:iron ABC transporter substrate-binding protein [Desulfamplus magnetovallimortis]SLM29775.1 conserved exported hypothetical protein [Desulfamplus magnetovallimortis]